MIYKRHIKEHKIITRGSWQYWGLMKRNDWSVLENEHYLQHYYLWSRASGKWSGSRTNHFIFVNKLNQFIKSDWSFWTSSRLEQHRSTSYSIKSHFQTPDSHSSWKWDTVAAYLILWWWMVPQTVPERRKRLDSNRRPMSRWYSQVWTEHLNEGTKWTFLWLLIVYVKRRADEVHFICFRHAKNPYFT